MLRENYPSEDVVRALIEAQPLIIRAIIKVESNGNPFAVSSVGAKGLMQLMPNTIRVFKVKDPFDPYENIRGGIALFKEELTRFRDEELALAAYNAGSPAVFKAIRDAQSRKFAEVRGYLHPQTRAYVPKVSQALLDLACKELL